MHTTYCMIKSLIYKKLNKYCITLPSSITWHVCLINHLQKNCNIMTNIVVMII